MLEPILVEGDVDVVLAGHEHLYERLLPQHGISYFISAAPAPAPGRPDAVDRPRGRLRRDYHFMLMEISGNELYFQAISRTGETVDAGMIVRPGT